MSPSFCSLSRKRRIISFLWYQAWRDIQQHNIVGFFCIMLFEYYCILPGPHCILWCDFLFLPRYFTLGPLFFCYWTSNFFIDQRGKINFLTPWTPSSIIWTALSYAFSSRYHPSCMLLHRAENPLVLLKHLIGSYCKTSQLSMAEFCQKSNFLTNPMVFSVCTEQRSYLFECSLHLVTSYVFPSLSERKGKQSYKILSWQPIKTLFSRAGQ